MAETRDRSWVWFFAVLAALGIAAILIPLVYNVRQQLTPEQVAAARECWRADGPASYVLDYEQR